MASLLEVRSVTKVFRGIVAVQDVTFSLERGEISCIIGPNGAGKSTLLKIIAGFLRPSSGRVVYQGDDITHVLPHARARRGIVTKFQVTNLYENLTARENLCVPVQQRVLGRVGLRDAADAIEARVDELLSAIGLKSQEDQRASALSHGERQWLEIGMVLGRGATLMLLDEPTAGMTTDETHATSSLLRQIAASSGTTMIIVEHDMHFVRAIAQQVRVMHLGRMLAEGSVAEIEASEQVRKIYVGQA